MRAVVPNGFNLRSEQTGQRNNARAALMEQVLIKYCSGFGFPCLISEGRNTTDPVCWA